MEDYLKILSHKAKTALEKAGINYEELKGTAAEKFAELSAKAEAMAAEAKEESAETVAEIKAMREKIAALRAWAALCGAVTDERLREIVENATPHHDACKPLDGWCSAPCRFDRQERYDIARAVRDACEGKPLKLDREEMTSGRCCGTCAWWAPNVGNKENGRCQAFPTDTNFPRSSVYWCCRLHETVEEQEARDPNNRSKP